MGTLSGSLSSPGALGALAIDMSRFLEHLAAAVVFGLLGIVLFVLALWLTVRVTPFSLRKEIEEDQNVALGVIVAAVFLGIAQIGRAHV